MCDFWCRQRRTEHTEQGIWQRPCILYGRVFSNAKLLISECSVAGFDWAVYLCIRESNPIAFKINSHTAKVSVAVLTWHVLKLKGQVRLMKCTHFEIEGFVFMNPVTRSRSQSSVAWPVHQGRPNALLVILWPGSPVAHLDTGWDQKKYIVIHYRWGCNNHGQSHSLLSSPLNIPIMTHWLVYIQYTVYLYFWNKPKVLTSLCKVVMEVCYCLLFYMCLMMGHMSSMTIGIDFHHTLHSSFVT